MRVVVESHAAAVWCWRRFVPRAIEAVNPETVRSVDIIVSPSFSALTATCAFHCPASAFHFHGVLAVCTHKAFAVQW